MEQEELVTALRTYGDRLLRSAFLLCGNTPDAEDIVQETFLQALRSIHRFQGRANIYTWLHAILLNVSRHHYRDKKRIIYDDELAAREAPPTNDNHARFDDAVASTTLQQALQKLSVEHREIIVLRYFENLKIQEIAGLLEISAGTVKSRLHYAIEELRKFVPAEMNLFGGSGTEEIQR